MSAYVEKKTSDNNTEPESDDDCDVSFNAKTSDDWVQIVFQCRDGVVTTCKQEFICKSPFFARKINDEEGNDITYHYPDFDCAVIIAYLGLEWTPNVNPELLRFLNYEGKCLVPGNLFAYSNSMFLSALTYANTADRLRAKSGGRNHSGIAKQFTVELAE